MLAEKHHVSGLRRDGRDQLVAMFEDLPNVERIVSHQNLQIGCTENRLRNVSTSYNKLSKVQTLHVTMSDDYVEVENPEELEYDPYERHLRGCGDSPDGSP